MKTLNKFLAVSFCLVLLFSFVSCSDDSGSNNMIDSYKQAAQKFIDAGDTASAIKALEEGIGATQDESLKAMLDSISPKEEAPAAEAANPEEKPQEQTPAAPAQPAPQPEAPTAPASTTPAPTAPASTTPAPAAPAQPTQEPAVSAKADSYYGLLSLPTPITSYTLSPDIVDTYYGDDLKGGEGYIDGYLDLCVIHDIVAIDGVYYAKVTYPGVKNYAYTPISEFINDNMEPRSVSVSSEENVYKRSDEQERFGTVYPTDTITAVSMDESRGTVQIIYNVDGGGYKMGWIHILALDEQW